MPDNDISTRRSALDARQSSLTDAKRALLEKRLAASEAGLRLHAPAKGCEEADRRSLVRGRRRELSGPVARLLSGLPGAFGSVARADRLATRESVGIGGGCVRDARRLPSGPLGLARCIGGGPRGVHRGIRNLAGDLEWQTGPASGRLPLADPMRRIRGNCGETRGFHGGPRRKQGRPLCER